MADPCPPPRGAWHPLVLLAAAAALLAALGLGGLLAARGMAGTWTAGAEAASVQVPEPAAATAGRSRLGAALALLRGSPEVASARTLSGPEVAALLRPWVGEAGISGALLPGVIAVRLAPAAAADALASRLAAAVPGAVLTGAGPAAARLAALAGMLRLGGWIGFAAASLLGAAIVGIATGTALAGRRDEVALCHALGAFDGAVARRLAARAAWAALLGGGAGTLAGLAALALLFAWVGADIVPSLAWLGFALLPPACAVLGFLAAWRGVGRWLRALP